MIRQRIQTVSGAVSLMLLLFFLVNYGQIMVRFLVLPLPNLSFNWAHVSFPAISFATPASPIPTLLIPKLGLSVPITENVSIDKETNYAPALTSGVALAQGTAGLLDSKGNSFIFGHSSNLSLKPTPFDTIFATLPSLQPGDTLQIKDGEAVSSYKVTISKVTSAKDVSYFSATSARTITLATCWPLGTNWKRWVVQAEKID